MANKQYIGRDEHIEKLKQLLLGNVCKDNLTMARLKLCLMARRLVAGGTICAHQMCVLPKSQERLMQPVSRAATFLCVTRKRVAGHLNQPKRPSTLKVGANARRCRRSRAITNGQPARAQLHGLFIKERNNHAIHFSLYVVGSF